MALILAMILFFAGPADTVEMALHDADPSVSRDDIKLVRAGGIRDEEWVGRTQTLMCGALISRPDRRIAAVVSQGRRPGKRVRMRELAWSWNPETTARERSLLAECVRRTASGPPALP